MDALRLSYTAKDQLHPLLSDVITAVNNVTGAKEFEGRQNIVKWLIVLNQMGAGDEISESQGRQVSSNSREYGFSFGEGVWGLIGVQMLFDIENAYNEFYKNLH